MDAQLGKWLEVSNAKMGQEGIPYIRRPLEAMGRLSLEFGIDVAIPSEFATQLFEWFEVHSPSGAHWIGSFFTGVFYYDTYFWRVEIPIGYGNVQLSGLDALHEMPASIKKQLQAEPRIMWPYVQLWIDTVDYALGINDLGRGHRIPPSPNQAFAADLIASADRELNATVRLLTESRGPNSKSWETARMSTEMFLKAYLAVHAKLSAKEAEKTYRHNLKKLATDCVSVLDNQDLKEILEKVDIFPGMSSRYQANNYDNNRLWSAYAVALRTAVTFTRSMTDRDGRSQFTKVGQSVPTVPSSA